ncbi:MAG: hypothetical protein C4293_12730 [Nitrospiraceae bacterium]
MCGKGWGDSAYRCIEAILVPGETVYVLGTAHHNPVEADSFDNPQRLYIGSHRDEMFIISDRSEKDLLAHLKWKVYGALCGGPVLTLLCLAAIFTWYLATAP